MALGLRYDGRFALLDVFNVNGAFQYSAGVVADDCKVEFLTLLQKNYSKIEGQSVVLTRDEAIAAAKAILLHFGEE